MGLDINFFPTVAFWFGSKNSVSNLLTQFPCL